MIRTQPQHASIADFCNAIEQFSRQTADPEVFAGLCELQAEALRITRNDVSVETVDMLLNTMLNSLWNLAEVRQQRRWTMRLKTAISRVIAPPKARPLVMNPLPTA